MALTASVYHVDPTRSTITAETIPLASPVAAALECAAPPHVRPLLCAADIADRRPTLDPVAKYLPHVPWRSGAEFRRDPYRVLTDTRRAEAILHWRPKHEWPGWRLLAEGDRGQ